MFDAELFRILKETPSWVLSIIGAGGSGKTTKTWWLLDNIFTEDTIFLFGYPERVRQFLPEHMKQRIVFFDSWREIAGKPGIVVLDDVAIKFLSSRRGSDSKDFISTLTIGRHQGHRYITTVQNSILSDKGVYESLDQYSLRCRMTQTQTLTEREEFQTLQETVNGILQTVALACELTDVEKKGLCYCPETDEVFRFPNWEYMTDELSMPFKGAYIEGGKVEFT